MPKEGWRGHSFSRFLNLLGAHLTIHRRSHFNVNLHPGCDFWHANEEKSVKRSLSRGFRCHLGLFQRKRASCGGPWLLV